MYDDLSAPEKNDKSFDKLSLQFCSKLRRLLLIPAAAVSSCIFYLEACFVNCRIRFLGWCVSCYRKSWWCCIPILLICVLTASPSFLSSLRRHQVSSIFMMQPVHFPSLLNTHHLAPVAEEARSVNIARHAGILSCNLSSYM